MNRRKFIKTMFALALVGVWKFPEPGHGNHSLTRKKTDVEKKPLGFVVPPGFPKDVFPTRLDPCTQYLIVPRKGNTFNMEIRAATEVPPGEIVRMLQDVVENTRRKGA